MNLKKNNTDIIKEIKNKGFCILEDCFDKNDLEEMKGSLLSALNYIQPNGETDLQKKYYQVKDYNRKLKGNWYDIAGRDINLLQQLHSPSLVSIVKQYFESKVIYSGRPCIGVHDDENVHLLEPHQETSQLSVDSLLFWAPLFDTNKDSGGLAVYENSHKHGYFDHTLDHPDGNTGWTKQYTHVSREISSKFKRKELEVKAGSAVLMISSCLHCGYSNKTKNSVRITVCERFNPLQKIPYLKDPKASLKIPFTGVDYNNITD